MSQLIRKPKKEPPTLMNFKVTREERIRIFALAKKYAGGNVSVWIRYCVLNCIPRKEDLTKE